MKVMITYGRRAPYPTFGWQMAKAFQQLGHTAIFLPVRDRPWWGTALKRVIPKRWKARWGWDQVAWANRLTLSAVERYRPALLIEVDGDLFSASTLQLIKRRWGTRLGVHLVEDQFREPPPPALFEYDWVASTSRIAVDYLRDAGISRAAYLPFATDPDWFRPSPRGYAAQVHPLSFIGAYSPKRVAMLESIADQLSLWGSEWDTRCASLPLRRALRDRRGVFGRGLVRCYQTSKLCINIQREHMTAQDEAGRPIGTGLGWRHFDVPACGSLVLTEEVLELPDAFVPGQEVETFRSPEELRDKARHLLSHEPQRQAMIQRARQRVLQEHTYLHRARKWVEWYERRLPNTLTHGRITK